MNGEGIAWLEGAATFQVTGMMMMIININYIPTTGLYDQRNFNTTNICNRSFEQLRVYCQTWGKREVNKERVL